MQTSTHTDTVYSPYVPANGRKSGRAIALWQGNTSTGKHYRYALRDDGAFFYQEFEWNGFGMGWGAWRAVEDPRAWRNGGNIDCDMAHRNTGDLFWISGGFVSGPRITADPEYFLPGVSGDCRASLAKLRLPCTSAVNARIY